MRAERSGGIAFSSGIICWCCCCIKVFHFQPELFSEMGIKPPKGVILYGDPGTGKTLLAKAVANSTMATFIRIHGSELVQKVSGEGPRLVRNLFRLAKDHSPSILFIDEIDAVGSKRHDTKSSGEKEVQRTMLELLNQLDGFDVDGDVKVINLQARRIRLKIHVNHQFR